MIPRLPPLLIALVGGASIYGIKYTLDKLEPKAIGPPGSSQNIERVLRYRRNVNRVGMAAAASGLIYAGYWIYESRVHRSTPSILKQDPIEEDKKAFYNDQYSEREKRYSKEREESRKKERERETLERKQLDKEVILMQQALSQNNNKDR